MLGRTIAAALLFVTFAQPGLAQSPADHQGHHPAEEQAASPQSSSPASPATERQSPTRGGDMMGMMGRGMMGQGMKGRGAMGGDAMEPSVVFRIIFALMDADGDGTASLPEFQAAHERIFRAMDRDKDGELTFEEMMTFMHRNKSSVPQQ
jgi:Ca2+-binding EF-hand superfamily protein